MYLRKLLFSVLIAALFLYPAGSFAQSADELITQLRAKLDRVNDYSAEGVMKTDVVFIKAPISKVKVYYKKPNLFRLKRDGGISLLPKGGVSINMSNLLAVGGQYSALDAGSTQLDKQTVRIIKLLPTDENSAVILSTLYIDAVNMLIKKAVTTTRENGTYEMSMQYGAQQTFGLPDRVIFSFNVKDYKLPKGITLEFEEGEKKDMNLLKNKRGRIQIDYRNYVINKGLKAEVFNAL